MKIKGRRKSDNVQLAPRKAPVNPMRGSPFALAAQKRAIADDIAHGVATRTSKKTSDDMDRAAASDKIKIAAKREGRNLAGKAIMEYTVSGKKPNLSEFDKKKYQDSMAPAHTQVTPGKWITNGK